jgi:hypothetical protein
VLLRTTTSNSDEWAGECARLFRFEPVEQELAIVIALGGQVAHRAATR